jgi:hypothetical protein
MIKETSRFILSVECLNPKERTQIGLLKNKMLRRISERNTAELETIA